MKINPEEYGQVIFRYTPTEKERKKNLPPTFWEVPEEIMVVEIPRAVDGCAVFWRWRGNWAWAQNGNRWLVRKLIELKAKLEKKGE